MAMRVQAFDIGCEPSYSGSAETVLADGWNTYLLFLAVSKSVGDSGYLKDLGVAVLAYKGCIMFKFGYPNDEGRSEHPLYLAGMADVESSTLEVVDSDWAKEVFDQRLASARRIWEGRGMDLSWARDRTLRHFIVTLKEKTFECLAASIEVERFCDSFAEAYTHVVTKFDEL